MSHMGIVILYGVKDKSIMHTTCRVLKATYSILCRPGFKTGLLIHASGSNVPHYITPDDDGPLTCRLVPAAPSPPQAESPPPAPSPSPSSSSSSSQALVVASSSSSQGAGGGISMRPPPASKPAAAPPQVGHTHIYTHTRVNTEIYTHTDTHAHFLCHTHADVARVLMPDFLAAGGAADYGHALGTDPQIQVKDGADDDWSKWAHGGCRTRIGDMMMV